MADKKKQVVIVREFNAPKELVFKAFTSPEALNEWWGPVDYPTTTMRLDFRLNGVFHYKMEVPGGFMWGRFIYKTIQEPDLLEFVDSFSDEKEGITRAPFSPTWPTEIFNRIELIENNGKTTMTLTIYPVNSTDEEYTTFFDMQKGIKEGYNAIFGELERYVNAQFKLRVQKNTSTKPRISTYLNFPGNAEEAFNLYKSVFGGEFTGGIQRFEDVPPQSGLPPVSDAVRKLILHMELEMPGGHVLMASDALKEMGFQLTVANNMHIQFEPASKAEAKRIFDALSKDGTITMPLQDMFWGAYYGSFTDRYGINWMINYIARE